MKFISLIVALVLFTPVALAESGATIFKNRCASCHTMNDQQPRVPILHGQEKRYLVSALKSFASGDRKDHVMGSMQAIASSLSAEEIESVTNYLAVADICDIDQKLDPSKSGFIDTFRKGAEIAKKINCQHCHGSFHHAAPRLFGQRKQYIIESIQAFKDGRRKNMFMERFVSRVADNEIEPLAHYYNGMVLMRECP